MFDALFQRRVVKELPEILLRRLDPSSNEFLGLQLVKVRIEHSSEGPSFDKKVDMGLGPSGDVAREQASTRTKDMAFGTPAFLSLCMPSLASRPLVGVSPAGGRDKRATSSNEACLFLINKTISKERR